MRERLLVIAVFAAIAIAALIGRGGASKRTTPPPIASAAPFAEGSTPMPAPWSAPARSKIAGWVVDPERHAVVGARVCATSLSFEHTDEESGPLCSVVGEDGQFAITDVPVGRWNVVASARGFVPARAEPFVDVDVTGHAPIEMRILRGGVPVEGDVEDPLGRPVSGAHVHAYPTTQSDVTFPEVDVEADSAGHFSVWLPEGAVDLEASAVGYASVDATFVSPTSKAKLRVRWEAILTGRVIDASGAGVPGARVLASGNGEHTVRAAADGSFTFTGLASGRWNVEATAPGLRGSAVSVLLDTGGRRDGILVVATRAARVDTRVIVGDGATPCTDGNVRLHDESTDRSLYADLDRNGDAHFDAVLPGSYRIEAECEGKDGSPSKSTLVVADRDLSGIVLTVREGLAARGVVVDDRGAPIAGVSVYACTQTFGYRSTTAVTAADGTFRLGGLSKGRWRLTASDNKHLEVSESLEIEASDVTGLRLVAGRGAVVRGKVVDAKGVGIAGVDVQLEGASVHYATTRDDGTFRVAGVAAGDHVAWASKNGARLAFLGAATKTADGDELAVDVPESGEVSIELRVETPSFTITGRVLDASGAPVVEASVYYRRQWSPDDVHVTDSDDIVLTDADGRFRIADLPRGEYALRARKKGVGEASTANVAAGSVAALSLVAHGSLVALLGAEAAHASVHLAGTGDLAGVGVFLHQDVTATNRARFDEVPPGTYTIDVTTDEGTGHAKVDVVANGEATVEVPVVAWGALVGTFAAGKSVALHCEDCTPSRYITVDVVNGAFRADRLQPGSYVVSVHDDTHSLASGTATVTSGALATAVFPSPVATENETDQ